MFKCDKWMDEWTDEQSKCNEVGGITKKQPIAQSEQQTEVTSVNVNEKSQ